MKKEVIYAIVAGGILGIFIAFGVWRINTALNSNGKKDGNIVQDNKIVSTKISIASPNSNDVVSFSPVTISGLSDTASLIVVSGEDTDALATSDNKGNFAADISLTGGVNLITAGFFDDKGNFENQTISVIFSTEFAKITPPPIPTDIKESTDSVRQKVQEKLNDAYNNPIAYMGTVTDISESTVQIKTVSGTIEQVSTSESPSVITDGKSPKEVKVTDIAIGDYIVAMGYTGNHVLTAKRILITSPNEASDKLFITGKVEKFTKKDFTILEKKEGVSKLILPDTNISVYLREGEKVSKVKFSNISLDDNVFVVGKTENGKIVARTVFIIGRP